MIVHELRHTMRRIGSHGRISAIFVVVACFLRALPLFFSTTPQAPRRVLCAIAFHTLNILRTSKPTRRHRRRVLAALLDFAESANAAFDNNPDYSQLLRSATPTCVRETLPFPGGCR
jgi:hypothetical protein